MARVSSSRSEAPGQAEPGELAAWDAAAYAFPDADCSITAIAADGAGNTTRATTEGVTTAIVPLPEPDATASVSGSEVGVIARRGPDAGRAAVLLDGQALGLVDLYAPVEEAPSIVFVADLPDGEHTISVEPTDPDGSGAVGLAVEGFATLELAGSPDL